MCRVVPLKANRLTPDTLTQIPEQRSRTRTREPSSHTPLATARWLQSWPLLLNANESKAVAVVSLDGSLITPAGSADADCVDVLEHALEKAKSGQTQAVAVFSFDCADNYIYETGGNVYVQRLIGLLAQAQHELIVKKLRHEERDAG